MKRYRVNEFIHVARVVTEIYERVQKDKEPASIRVNDITIVFIPDERGFRKSISEEDEVIVLTNKDIWSPRRTKEVIE